MQRSSHSLRPMFPLELFHLGAHAPPMSNARSRVICVALHMSYRNHQLPSVEDGKLLKFHPGLVYIQHQVVNK